jgi:hypothetical protein
MRPSSATLSILLLLGACGRTELLQGARGTGGSGGTGGVATTPASDCSLVDTRTDNRNCGECGRVCSAPPPSTAECTAGRCLVTLASGQKSVSSIAVDAGNVYWTDQISGIMALPGKELGTVMKVPVIGGTAITLASGQAYPSGILPDATGVYWTTFSFASTPPVATVTRVSSSGGAPALVFSLTSAEIESIAVTADAVYLTSQTTSANPDGSVTTVSLSDGTSDTIASGLSMPGRILLDATNVYWADLGDAGPMGGSLMKAPLRGGTPTALVSGIAPTDIAVDATSIYWSDSAQRAVMTVPLAGGAPTMLVSWSSSFVGAIAVDDTSVYWTAYMDGTVMKAPLGGGAPTTLVAGQASPAYIAVDDTSVYWSNAGTLNGTTSATVMKLTPK